MIRINLLPLADRKQKWPLKKIFAIISGLLVFTLIMIYASSAIVIWQKERQIAEVQNQYELLRPTEAVMNESFAKQHTINTKNDVLTNLTNQRRSWSPIITHLATLTTSRVWFTDLGVVNKDAIKIVGIAENYQEVATFLERLEQDTVFTEPQLVQAELTPVNNKKVTKFEIVAKFKGIK